MADLWAFDFDGTLVETAAIKRAAFFAIFPDCHAGVVEAVLTRLPDASRHEVIPLMVAAAEDPALDAAALVSDYGALVVEQVGRAPSVDGAEDALEWAASNGNACLFSMTPHDELVAAVRRRGWERLLADIRGYPAEKSVTLAEWMRLFDAGVTTVIGDGESDAHAAAVNGVKFIHAQVGWPGRLYQSVPT